jgi:pyruvate kinase
LKGHGGQFVATLGPASLDAPESLVAAGATGLRLNASHMSAAALRLAISRVRSTLPVVPVVVDLQGAKMRLGCFAARPLRQGETISFGVRGDGVSVLALPHPELFASVRTGDTLSLDDGRIHLTIVACDAECLDARVARDCELRPRKGVNVLDHPVVLEDLGEADRSACEALREISGIEWAVSFVTDGHEADWVRRRIPGARIIAKVERAEALRNIERIASRVDELWICRGDLGAQVGMAELARFVSSFDPRPLPVGVLMAGQVFEHLTTHSEPTRSEVCHLHDLVLRGYAGFVLSDETAVGVDPVRAVSTARALSDSFASRG